ncbi:hypothetical protein CB1_001129002 [Camelus ferus]|nr:hypothetical protein CB1_001129002 [Camelus ferus]
MTELGGGLKQRSLPLGKPDAIRPMDLFRVLWRPLSKEVKELVGTDRFGNKYYYIPEYRNWRVMMDYAKRKVDCAVSVPHMFMVLTSEFILLASSGIIYIP